MFELLTQDQIIVIATAAIIQLLKIIWVKLLKKPKPSAGQIRWIVFIVAIPLAYFMGGFNLMIPTEDPMKFALALIAEAGEILLFAHVLYEAILEGVLKWLDEKLLKRSKVLAP